MSERNNSEKNLDDVEGTAAVAGAAINQDTYKVVHPVFLFP